MVLTLPVMMPSPLPRILVGEAAALLSRIGRSGERRDDQYHGSISCGWKRYPPPGSVVYRSMGADPLDGGARSIWFGVLWPTTAHVEHSGIYVGDGWFVSRQKDGMIERERLDEFMANKHSLLVSARDGSAFGKASIAKRAKARIGGLHASGKLSDSDGYSLITNNCHTFCSYCISGTRSPDSTLWELKGTAESSLRVTEWLEWQYED